MCEFVASLWWSFWSARWWVIALVLLLTMPIVSLFVQLLSSPMSYLTGGTLRVMCFGWAVGVLLCAVHRAFQTSESRQCERSFFVSSLLAALPGALLIVALQKINAASSTLNYMLADVVGYVPGAVMGIVGMLLAWMAATSPRPRSRAAVTAEPEPLRLRVDGKEAVIVDLRQGTPESHCTVIPHSDGKGASAHGMGGNLQVGHVLLVSRLKVVSVYQIEHIRYRTDQPGKWHAQLRCLRKATCASCSHDFNPAQPCPVCARRRTILPD